MWSLKFGNIKPTASCVTVIFIMICVSAQDFGYEGQHGPQHWAEDFKRCSGKHQSPINIDELKVVLKEFPPLYYYHFESSADKMRIGNNGHTVLVTMDFKEGKEARIKGGPLERQSEYQFEQFHFHWGLNDTIGSEDLVNNHAYPAELHMVMRSTDYKDFQSAMGQDHGIAVMAFFLKIDKDDNIYYDEFVESLEFIGEKGMWTDLPDPPPLIDFVPRNLLNYYSYVGSLTTPPCAEKVVWIDYQTPITISEKQLNHFRQLTFHDAHLRNNYRPPQPINDRIIYENEDRVPDFNNFGFSAIPFVDADNAADKSRNGLNVALLLISFAINLVTKFYF